jgi:hypothetical protein
MSELEVLEAQQQVMVFLHSIIGMFYAVIDNTEYCSSVARMHNIDWLTKHLELKVVVQSVRFDINKEKIDGQTVGDLWKIGACTLKNKKFVNFVSNLLADVGNKDSKFDAEAFLSCNEKIGMDVDTLEPMLVFFESFAAFVDHAQIKDKVSDIKDMVVKEMKSILSAIRSSKSKSKKSEKEDEKDEGDGDKPTKRAAAGKKVSEEAVPAKEKKPRAEKPVPGENNAKEASATADSKPKAASATKAVETAATEPASAPAKAEKVRSSSRTTKAKAAKP